jgi:tight adherence protein B
MAAFKLALIQALVFFAVLAFLLGAHFVIRAHAAYRGTIRSRLHAREKKSIDTREDLFRVRRERSLSAEGDYLISWLSLNKLILQSGSKIGIPGLIGMGLSAAGVVIFASHLAGADLQMTGPGAILAGFAFPIVYLRSLRGRRQDKFEEQLPDAIDVIVRSLKAGHSLPVAIASAGKNMPDPIGGEFALTAAEVTYGLDLETAMQNMRSRVGQADLAMIVLAVSVQSKTGGNLAEVLGNLSKIIRERFKLRRKAYALAAEGRFSAILLSILPIGLFGMLHLISPSYYGDVAGNTFVKPILGGAIVWMLIGDYIMYKMVRIKV